MTDEEVRLLVERCYASEQACNYDAAVVKAIRDPDGWRRGREYATRATLQSAGNEF